MGVVRPEEWSDDDKESLWQRVKQKWPSRKPKDNEKPPQQRQPPDAPRYSVGTQVRSCDWTLCTVDKVQKNGTNWEYQLSRADSTATPKFFDDHKWQEERKVYGHDDTVD